jgi:hypothetical protein
MVGRDHRLIQVYQGFRRLDSSVDDSFCDRRRLRDEATVLQVLCWLTAH